MPKTAKSPARVVSALHVRSNFGRILQQVDGDQGSLVIEKRGRPRAILLSIQGYVRLAAPEPEVLKVIGEESKRNGTAVLAGD
jgi:PHD/YefM family antitoxin component YafN of YafNO toxin-antitoxin module